MDIQRELQEIIREIDGRHLHDSKLNIDLIYVGEFLEKISRVLKENEKTHIS